MDDGLACWWCVHPLPCLPCIHLPVKHDEKTNKFITKGNFCSWQCAKAYALDMNTSRSGEIQMILMMMRRRAFGKYTPLWPAPKREALKIFGGTMTIDEFRSFGGLVEPPMVCFPDNRQLIQIVGVQPFKQAEPHTAPGPTNSRGKLAAIDSATSQGDTLKLKRNKPLERTKSKLENVLGITRKAQT
ncbi:hypothetical protein [Yellowstone lake phycodnavirus 3]|uniref:hypothetical protein n=1 Tax=Yellowstone lake phycodnavirus 3 TaxID=1586715 RepID=UPI0006EBD607|nr:hypothetical protein AR677_gp193 [Yellowstone lake phycodnavirus 3]BAT22692.1 hypothetical protein [Yellowstone lake phycodnavirus 3]